MQRKANSKFEERQVPSKQRLPSDAPSWGDLGGTVLLFSCRFGCPPAKKSLENLRNPTGERNHGEILMAAEFELSLFFLQKRHGKNMSLALSFNRALQKCFAQRVREAKNLETLIIIDHSSGGLS